MQTPKTGPKRQIMIIVWRWNTLENVSQNNHEFESHFPISHGIEGYYNIFYDSIKVEQSPESPYSEIFRLNIPGSDNGINFLHLLLDTISDADNKVLLFLHEANGFSSDSVARILSDRADLAACFLFGDGKNFIYASDIERQGLLGDGDFFDSHIYPQGKRIRHSVVKRDKSDIVQVKAEYFNQVWNYYASDFSRSLWKLFYDLNEILYPFCLPSDELEISLETLGKEIQHKGGLSEKLESLLEHTSKVELQLQRLALHSPEEIKLVFRHLLHQINILLHNPENEQKISKFDLIEIRDTFYSLLLNLPKDENSYLIRPI